MPIETKDLVLYESERLTDNEDGGGQYNGQVIADGQSNNLFDDVSELDRTMGDVSMRKIFPAVTTNDTDKLMGATVFISENPKDPNVSALLFSTKNWTDERRSAQNRVENYLAKGGQIAGTPLDTHWQGMKQLQVAMFPQETESSVGDTIVLISDEGGAFEFEQYVRITKVETRTAILIIDGKNIEYKIATYTLNDALLIDFIGLSASQWYNNQKSKTLIRETLVADTGEYCASVGLSEDVQFGEYTVNAKSIFTQLIPSAQTESPIIDVNAASESVILVPGNDGLITANFSTTVGVNQNLYMGSAVMPSSMAFTLFGQSITDQGGLLKNSQGTQVGTIDYQRGLIQWTEAATAGSTTLGITFNPAAAPKQYFQSHAVPVTQNNQSSNWTGVLVPIPAPGSLSISYMSQGKFYELKDDGSGQLKGVSSSFGSGRIDYETGSWLLTTGALPDVDTPILLLWGTPIVTFVRSNLSVEKAAFEFDLGQIGIAAGVTIHWMLEGVAKTAISNAFGKFTGDATGEINYANGTGKIIPNKLPQKNTQFTLTYNYGAALAQTKFAIAPDGNQKLSLSIGTGSTLQPNSIELVIPVSDQLNTQTGVLILVDTPIDSSMGNLLTSTGDIQGTINYDTGAVEVTPVLIKKQFTQMYKTVNFFAKVLKIVGSDVTFKAYQAATILVKYRDTSGVNAGSKIVTADKLRLDLSSGFDEQILTGSARFKVGLDTFLDRTGTLYRNVDPSIASGVIQYGTGKVEIDSWTPNTDNAVVLEALTTTTDLPPLNQISFRTPVIPIRPQSLTVVVASLELGQITLTTDENGVIETSRAHGSINHETGFVNINFYTKTEITPANRAEIEANDWYDVLLEYAEAGKTYINVPVWIDTSSVRYNAIAYTYIPLDSEILGLSATRLPLDGRVPIFRVGDIGIISASKAYELPDSVAGQTYSLADQRISYLEIEDSEGSKVPFDMYVVDYDYGKFTLNGDFALGALVAPLKAKYRYQDMGLIRDVQINGQITFTKPVTHNYSTEDSIVGSALVIGDMQARYTRKFVQPTWSNVWADEVTGGAISANYNDSLYPILTTNNGAIQERWALIFTDATNFRYVGEYSGQIGQGNVNADFAPINPVTGVPYFTVKKEGWGAGWASGNVLRFNTIAATYPVWVIRTVKQSEPTVLSDQFQIMLRGDIDRAA